MKLKKAAAIALAFATTAALCVPATALAADPDPTAGTPENVIAADGTKSSVITGTIKPTTLKVSVPTVVSFDVDPGATPSYYAANSDGVSGQFKSPSNFTITNYSVVDVYGYVSGVAAAGCTLSQAGPTAGVRAADGAAWDTLPAVQIVASDAAPGTWDAPADWFDTVKTKQFYAFNSGSHGKLAASADGTAEGGKATMYMLGRVTQGGWKAGDTFTVTPTFTIKTADPGAAQNS